MTSSFPFMIPSHMHVAVVSVALHLPRFSGRVSVSVYTHVPMPPHLHLQVSSLTNESCVEDLQVPGSAAP